MIFAHGFVHCDPHPGNVLIRKDGNGRVEVVLLDHGLYTVSVWSPLFLHHLLELWLAVVINCHFKQFMCVCVCVCVCVFKLTIGDIRPVPNHILQAVASSDQRRHCWHQGAVPKAKRWDTLPFACLHHHCAGLGQHPGWHSQEGQVCWRG